MLKKLVLNCINNFKGEHVVCLDVHDKCNITDFIILCTGQSNRHVISIAQAILYKLHHKNFQLYGIEGLKEGEWVLVDAGDIIIHVMQEKIRTLYALEKLWN